MRIQQSHQGVPGYSAAGYSGLPDLNEFTDEELEAYNDYVNRAKRIRRVNTTPAPKGRGIMRAIGPYVFPVLSSVVGSKINDNQAQGAVVGGVLGFAPNIIGAIAASITKPRGGLEYAESEIQPLYKYMIPGYAVYDHRKNQQLLNPPQE